MSPRKLGQNKAKRDTAASGEPAPGTVSSGKPCFVIQKHDASSLHFDFRLEIDGVLKSWAVPKGPSTDPRDKRLAIETDDHPLDYGKFEGVIPEDDYGGGTVMIWDRGHFSHLNDDGNASLAQCHEGGRISVWLQGEKLSGGYALIRTGESGEKSHWLLIKMDDAAADARRKPASTQNRSVASGRSMRDIGRERD